MAVPRGFARTLAFGALAALLLPVASCVVQWVVGSFGSARHGGASPGSDLWLSFYWLLGAAGLLLISAESRRARAGVVTATLVGGLVLIVATPSLPALAVSLTFAVACARSGLLFRQAAGRATAIEAACGVVSLGLAAVLYTPTLFGAALSLWGWFLAESCFYLLVALAPRRARGDPFDAARSSLLELLGP